MSAESKKINHYKNFPLQTELEDRTPKSRFIKFNFNTLEPKRRSLALRQIKIYIKKITLYPNKLSFYVEEINKVIKYEKIKVKKIEHI